MLVICPPAARGGVCFVVKQHLLSTDLLQIQLAHRSLQQRTGEGVSGRITKRKYEG